MRGRLPDASPGFCQHPRLPGAMRRCFWEVFKFLCTRGTFGSLKLAFGREVEPRTLLRWAGWWERRRRGAAGLGGCWGGVGLGKPEIASSAALRYR